MSYEMMKESRSHKCEMRKSKISR